MIIRTIRDSLILICLTLVAFSLGIVAWHMPRWARAADKTMLHVDEFAGEGKIAMKNLAESSRRSRESAELVSRELPVLADQLHGSLTKFNTVLDSADATVQEARGTVREASGTLRATTAAVATFDRQATRIGDSVTAALEGIPPTLESSRQLMGSARLFIDGPLSTTTRRADDVLVPASWLMYDTQQKVHGWLYPAPYTGKFKALHQTWGITRGLFPLAQPTYYVVKIAKGN